VAGPVGLYHSRLALCAFLAGFDATEAEDLFNPLVFHRAGYAAGFAREREKLLTRFAIYGLDLTPAFEAWRGLGCFMQAPDRPNAAVLISLAALIAAQLGLPKGPPEGLPIGPDMGPAAAIDDALAGLPRPPVFAETARWLGLAAPLPALAAGRELALGAYIAASYAAFSQIPRLVLRAADGVAAAMEALGLTEAAVPPAEAALLGSALLTADGLVLRVELTSTRLLARPLWPEDPGEADFRLILPAGRLRKPLKLQVLDGIECLPEADGVTLRVRRGRGFLAAPPGKLLAVFAPQAGTEGVFLPLSHALVAGLRRLLGHAWRVPATDAAVPRDAIVIEPGYRLRVGTQLFDLSRTMLLPGQDAEGVALLSVEDGQEKLLLRLDAAAAARDEILLAAASLPGDAASVEAFRAEAGACLTVSAPAERLHAPLTVCDVDRDWVLGALDKPGAPVLGRVAQQLTLARLRDAVVLLSAGHAGTLLSAQGVHKGMAALRLAAEMPEGMRRDGPHLLAERALLRRGPLVEGPVCVPYGPHPERAANWLTGGLLHLHAMAPYLPEGTRILLPGGMGAGGGFTGGAAPRGADTVDALETMRALGLTQFKLLDLPVASARVEDVVWLEGGGAVGVPGWVMRGFRERTRRLRGVPNAGKRKLYLRQSGARRVVNVQQVEGFLTHHGLECIDIDTLGALEQIDLFLQAGFVIAPHGAGLANLLVCAAGTKVLEFSPETALRPDYWLISEKLGLNYAMLPCETQDGNFNGAMTVDAKRMRGLFRMLGYRD